MRWQKAAQLLIAGFVVIFIGVVAVSMRRHNVVPKTETTPSPELPKGPGRPEFINPNPGEHAWYDGDRKVFEIKFGKHVAYEQGRQLFSDGVRVVLPRDGKDFVVNAREADVKVKGNLLETAFFKGDVSMTRDDGVEVKAGEATYSLAEGMVKMPGAVEFRKGRLRGNGVGATYDLNREVLWLLDRGTFNVSPDKAGQGALAGSAAAIGLARREHYARLTKDAHINGDGRDIRADEITVNLTEDEERVRMLQLRGNSRMDGSAGGPQSMSAQDIDVTYGEDGRTLQNANLMERAVVEMAPSPEQGRGAGKRISGKTINIGMAPDGKTVTLLTATENAQVDLPAEGNLPAKRIRSATLVASGAPAAGLQSATFSGKVDYRETRAAGRGAPAAERTATSESLVIDTKPGLGAVQKADFKGNVTFTDGDLKAEAQRGIYHLERDRIELMPADGVPGKPPRVTDGKIDVGAKTIEFTMGTRELTADTKVRSLLQTKPAGRGQATKVPSVLKPNQPINVTSNRLQYQGTAGKAVYSGTVIMWQEGGDSTTIKGDTLTLDDKTGNLEVNGHVITDFLLEETDKTTGEKTRSRTVGKADAFVFDDKQRLATYTGNAQLDGPQGNLSGHKIEVFLKADANQIERLEAYPAQGGVVTMKEPKRTARGAHLTYKAEDESYLMIGTPVEVIEEEQGGNCRVGKGTTITFYRGQSMGEMKGSGTTLTDLQVKPCSEVKR